MYKNKSISLLASGLVALLAACGQTEVKPPEEPTVEAQVLALNLNVGSLADSPDANPGNGICWSVAGGCTLRAAVEETNAWPTKDKINVPAGIYWLTNNRLEITDSVVIRGAQEGQTIVDGGEKDMVFYVINGARQERMSAEFHFLTIRNGYAQSAGGGIRNDGAKVLVNKSTVMMNDAFSAGGGIHNQDGGILEVKYSSIFGNGNTQTIRAGGISNTSGSFVFIYKSTVHNNDANRYGGIGNSGLMNIANSTISKNRSRIDIGGMMNSGQANLNNVTLVSNQGTMEYDNSPGSAGGLANSGTVQVANSIIANNINHFGSAQDCIGNVTSMGYNLIEDTTDCTVVGDLTGNLIGVDPMLGFLWLNGGLTHTHALDPASPAKNAGNPAAPTGVGTTCEPDDQRSTSRGFGPAGRCDMGAYELGGAPGGKVSP